MNWFKFSKNFAERNTINSKIRYLKGVRDTLITISKLIFQSGRNAKNINYKIISSAKITSYPALRETLIEADSLALDSPWKFAVLCQEGVKRIDNLVQTLKLEREEITRGNRFNKPKKGIIW